MKKKDKTGERHGMLLVCGVAKTTKEPSTGRNRRSYLCKCDCGKETIVAENNLRTTGTRSCGCMRGIGNKRTARHRSMPFNALALNKIYSQYKVRARLRGILFKLDKEYVKNIIHTECYYCGVKDKNLFTAPWSLTHNGKKYAYNGIDRINSSIGYVPGNVVPCCGQCNTMKMDYSAQEFIRKCRDIIEYQKNPLTKV